MQILLTHRCAGDFAEDSRYPCRHKLMLGGGLSISMEVDMRYLFSSGVHAYVCLARCIRGSGGCSITGRPRRRGNML